MYVTLAVLVEHWKLKTHVERVVYNGVVCVCVCVCLTARGVGDGLRTVVLVLGIHWIPRLHQEDVQVPRSILLHRLRTNTYSIYIAGK